MAKVRYTAQHIKSGIRGRIILDLTDKDEIKWVGEFFKKKIKYEEKAGMERLLEIEMSVHYKKKTVDQWGLYQELINRLAMKQNCGKDQIHRGVKFNCYPMVDGLRKNSAELNSREMAKVIEYTIGECYEKDVDVRDIHSLWTTWRFKQKYDPLIDSYRNMADYKLAHPYCEASLKPLLADEGQMVHIVSVGAGGSDKDWNRMRLSTEVHIMTQHAKGWLPVIEQYPICKPKVVAAWIRAGVVPKEYKQKKLPDQELEDKQQINLF